MSDMPGAWTSNVTGPGRELPERLRVGGQERSTMMRSVHAAIVEDIARCAAVLIATGEASDPLAAAELASAMWTELVDDARCAGLVVVLDKAEAA